MNPETVKMIVLGGALFMCLVIELVLVCGIVFSLVLAIKAMFTSSDDDEDD
jgi:hypothetical protein